MARVMKAPVFLEGLWVVQRFMSGFRKAQAQDFQVSAFWGLDLGILGLRAWGLGLRV